MHVCRRGDIKTIKSDIDMKILLCRTKTYWFILQHLVPVWRPVRDEDVGVGRDPSCDCPRLLAVPRDLEGTAARAVCGLPGGAVHLVALHRHRGVLQVDAVGQQSLCLLISNSCFHFLDQDQHQ